MLSTSRIHILYLSIISRLHFPLIFLYFSIISQSSLGYISQNLFANPSYRISLHALTQIFLDPDLVVNHCSANIFCWRRFVLQLFCLNIFGTFLVGTMFQILGGIKRIMMRQSRADILICQSRSATGCQDHLFCHRFHSSGPQNHTPKSQSVFES